MDNNGAPSLAISSDPSNSGGRFITGATFVSDALTIEERLTINAGLRFDHSHAIGQDLPPVDLEGHETDRIVAGRGTLYTGTSCRRGWVSPRSSAPTVE